MKARHLMMDAVLFTSDGFTGSSTSCIYKFYTADEGIQINKLSMIIMPVSLLSQSSQLEELAGPTTTCLVLLRLLIKLSGSCKWAFTSSAGTDASHWLRERSWKVPELEISRNLRVLLPVFST